MEWYVFTDLERNSVVKGLLALGGSRDRRGYFEVLPQLLDFACTKANTANTVREYVVRLLLDSPLAGKYCVHPGAEPFVRLDLDQLWENLLAPDWDELCTGADMPPFPKGAVLPKEQTPYLQWVERLLRTRSGRELEQGLQDFFGNYAGSDEARYIAFRWKGGALQGISSPDPLSFEMLGGLEHQKRALIDNTRSFVRGGPANDVLLVGGSGTGKSSCVKAVLNCFAHEGLRLVEVAKQELNTLPALLRTLREKRCRYIVFVDDLSFERTDEDYLELKVALDGQVEKRPENVLIYATSNRRRLVRESWRDRDTDDDVHENDTLHEKLSLSERFGIRLYFPVLTQGEYFDIVRLLLSSHGVEWSEELGRRAANWATQYNGRSGRTAKQFAADYLAAEGGGKSDE